MSRTEASWVGPRPDVPPVAVITGAASGIGAACAVDAARRGMNVVVGFHESDSHDPNLVVSAVRSVGGQAIAHPVDVGDTASVDACAVRAFEEWGRIDVVVANAGIARRAPLASLDDDTWHHILSVNLGGVLRIFRASVPFLGRGGSMIAVSSVSGGVYGWADHAHYTAAKAGMLGLVRSLALELGSRGIRVNAVLPGTIDTPMAQDPENSLGAAGIELIGQTVPLGRAGSAADVASAIGFLASDAAAYITGTSLIVDGGMTAVMPK